jgi:hypothetical protein
LKLVKTIQNPKADLVVSYKQPTARNFNQIIGVKNLNFCDFFSKNIFNVIASLDEKLRELGIVHECPYVNDEVIDFNFTATKFLAGCIERDLKDKNKPIFNIGIGWPDGFYILNYKVHTKNDPEGLSIKYYYQSKNGDNRAF